MLLNGLSIRSRSIANLSREELGMAVLPSFECLNRGFVVERLLHQVMVVEPDVAQQSGLQILAGLEVMADMVATFVGRLMSMATRISHHPARISNITAQS